ncbi:MAG: hypothetical protein IT529_12880 [Burkholderiales bacterium]|nr:hypothetical protein [Burkholderiales bacterium]
MPNGLLEWTNNLRPQPSVDRVVSRIAALPDSTQQEKRLLCTPEQARLIGINQMLAAVILQILVLEFLRDHAGAIVTPPHSSG